MGETEGDVPRKVRKRPMDYTLERGEALATEVLAKEIAALSAEVKRLQKQQVLYENAQCITCARHLDESTTIYHRIVRLLQDLASAEAEVERLRRENEALRKGLEVVPVTEVPPVACERSYVENLHTMRTAIAVSEAKRNRDLEALIVKWRSEADRSKLLQGLDCAADLEALIR